MIFLKNNKLKLSSYKSSSSKKTMPFMLLIKDTKLMKKIIKSWSTNYKILKSKNKISKENQLWNS